MRTPFYLIFPAVIVGLENYEIFLCLLKFTQYNVKMLLFCLFYKINSSKKIDIRLQCANIDLISTCSPFVICSEGSLVYLQDVSRKVNVQVPMRYLKSRKNVGERKYRSISCRLEIEMSSRLRRRLIQRVEGKGRLSALCEVRATVKIQDCAE